eukprot:g7231.t1
MKELMPSALTSTAEEEEDHLRDDRGGGSGIAEQASGSGRGQQVSGRGAAADTGRPWPQPGIRATGYVGGGRPQYDSWGAPANPGGSWGPSGGYTSSAGSGIGDAGYAGGGRLPYDNRGAPAYPGGQWEPSGGYTNGRGSAPQWELSGGYTSGKGSAPQKKTEEKANKSGGRAVRVWTFLRGDGRAVPFSDKDLAMLVPRIRIDGQGVVQMYQVGNVDVNNFSSQRYVSGVGGQLAAEGVEMDRRVEALFGVITALAGYATSFPEQFNQDICAWTSAVATVSWSINAASGGIPAAAAGDMPDIMPVQFGHVQALFQMAPTAHVLRTSDQLGGMKARAPGRGANGGRERGESRERNRSGGRAVESREGHRARAWVGGGGFRRRYIGGTCRSGSEVEGGETNAGER